MNRRTVVMYVSMFAMIIAFVIWSMMSPIAPQIAKEYHLSVFQKSILIATPVLLGSILRIPVGMVTDRCGGRRVYTILLIYLVIPLIGLGFAHSFGWIVFWEVLLGVAGASFAVGIGHVSAWYPSDKQGLVLGVTALGNIGSAVAGFLVPMMFLHLGFQSMVNVLLIPVVLAAALVWFFTRDPHITSAAQQRSKAQAQVREEKSQAKFWSKPSLWILSAYYFLTFGGFVAFGNYLPTLLQSQFGLQPVDAGLRASGFVILATVMRPLGGYLADRIRSKYLLAVVFIGLTIFAALFAFSLSDMAWTTISALFIALLLGLGNGTVFKVVPESFPKQTGKATGIIGAIGGIGGFFPPLVMGAIKQATGSFGGGLLLLAGCSFVVLILIFLSARKADAYASSN